MDKKIVKFGDTEIVKRKSGKNGLKHFIGYKDGYKLDIYIYWFQR